MADKVEKVDKDEPIGYRPLISFLMKETKAMGVVLVVLYGEHGSCSLVASRAEELMHAIPGVLEELIENIKDGILKSSTN